MWVDIHITYTLCTEMMIDALGCLHKTINIRLMIIIKRKVSNDKSIINNHMTPFIIIFNDQCDPMGHG